MPSCMAGNNIGDSVDRADPAKNGIIPKGEEPLFESVSAEELAEKVDLPENELIWWAALGHFPPWVCEPRAEGWAFANHLTKPKILKTVESGVVWVPNAEEDVAHITMGWLSSSYDRKIREQNQVMLLDWLRQTEDPLQAEAPLLCWWCMWSPNLEMLPPSASETAQRWQIVADWYEMLTDAGVGHSAPHHGTRIGVMFEEPE